jgi:hypothetical protein
MKLFISALALHIITLTSHVCLSVRNLATSFYLHHYTRNHAHSFKTIGSIEEMLGEMTAVLSW